MSLHTVSEQSSPLNNLLRTQTAPAPTLLNHIHTNTRCGNEQRPDPMPEKRQKESQKKVDNEEKNDCDDDNDSVGT